MSDYIPDPWRSQAERKGITPTYRPLGDRAGLAHETVRRVISGQSVSKHSIRKLADALGVDVETIHEWRHEAPPDYGAMFEPDPSSMLLTTEERAVINSLIRLLTEGRGEQQGEGEGHVDSSAANTRAEVSSAHVDDVPVRKREVRTARGRVVRRGDRAQGPSAPRG